LLAKLGAGGQLSAPKFSFSSPPWQAFWRAAAIIGIGQALMSFATVIDQLMASHVGQGSIAALGYADRVIALIIGLGATAAVRATLPAFSTATASNSENVTRFAFYWAKVLFVGGLAAAGLLWLIAPWVVQLLFQRGAFTQSDVAVVAEIMRYGVAQIPFYFAGVVLTSLIAAQRRYKVLASIAATCLLVKVAANLLFVPALGVKGLALATTVMYAASLGMRMWFVRRPEAKAVREHR
jgi:peptidoglycan biosynthesis protein MviN/MurJ (putative lipid II flippase)